MAAFGGYTLLHSFDGYTSEDVSSMAKNKPHVRSSYNKCMNFKARLENKMGKKRKVQSFTELVN